MDDQPDLCRLAVKRRVGVSPELVIKTEQIVACFRLDVGEAD